jgi:hypothetical protein
MERPSSLVIDHQQRALTFMLDALGLPPAPDEVSVATRIVELEHTVAALLAEKERAKDLPRLLRLAGVEFRRAR